LSKRCYREIGPYGGANNHGRIPLVIVKSIARNGDSPVSEKPEMRGAVQAFKNKISYIR
jgi:hypothetical protein